VDSEEEARYRLGIAGEHLHRAREEMGNFKREKRGVHLAGCVGEAQLCIEGAAKAMTSAFGVPTKAYDPSVELREILAKIWGELSENLVKAIERLADLASKVAPEHVRATYGDGERRLLPSELYDEGPAREFLEGAERAYETAGRFLKEWFVIAS